MPDGKYITYDTYDNAKQLTKFTDYFGNITNYTYEAGYLKTIKHNNTPTDYYYNSDGSIDRIWFGNDTKTMYTYNPLGLTAGINNLDGNGSVAYANINIPMIIQEISRRMF